MATSQTITNLVQCESGKASVWFQKPSWSYFHGVNSLIGRRCIDANVRRCDWKQSSNLTACARMKNMVTCRWGGWGEEEEEAICPLWHSTLPPQWKMIHLGPLSDSPSRSGTAVTWHFANEFIGLRVCICILWRPHSRTDCVTPNPRRV